MKNRKIKKMQGIGFYNQDFFIIKRDYDHISESIMRILMTNKRNRVGNPYFGVGLKSYLFENFDETARASLEEEIREQVELYEPRVNIISLNIEKKEENKVLISIGFKIKGDLDEDARFLNLNIDLEE